jgi:hypothetical protein
LSVDKNCRHRGKDEKDSPLLLEGDAATGECDVVIGRKQGDQAEDEAANGLSQTKPVETGPGAKRCCKFWQNQGLLAAHRRRGWIWGGWGHTGGREAWEAEKTSIH